MQPSIRRLGTVLGVLAILGLTGCASSDPLPQPAGMGSSAAMAQDPARPGAWIYRVPNVDLRSYTRFIVEPATVYRGPEAEFGDLTASQLAELAQTLSSETRRELGQGYTVTSRPGPGAARIVMKLVRVEETVPGAATASRILPIGAVANAIQGASGGSGSFTGGVVVAAEIYDSQTGRLLVAAVRRYTPAVFDIEATLSTMDTARAAVRKAAQDLRTAVDRTQGRATNRE